MTVDQSGQGIGAGATTAGPELGWRWEAETAPAPQDSHEALPAARILRADPEDLTDAVGQARRGDQDAFRVIYRAIQPGLLRYLRVLVGEDAEDVASEAWLQITRDLSKFRGDGAGFRGWAATVARHRALDHLRRQRRRPQLDLSVDQIAEIAGSDDTAGHAIQAMSTDAAIRLIAGLPRDQAEAVLLRVVMGLDAQSAGRVLGKRPGAVRTATHRGLRRLAEQLGQPTTPPDPRRRQS